MADDDKYGSEEAIYGYYIQSQNLNAMAASIPSLLTVAEAQRQLADRMKALRLHVGFKRTTLAERSGVSARTLQRFEDTGEVSLRNLLRVAHVLGRLPEFGHLLAAPEARTLAELNDQTSRPPSKRGKI